MKTLDQILTEALAAPAPSADPFQAFGPPPPAPHTGGGVTPISGSVPGAASGSAAVVETITTKELAELAGRLVRAKSENRQSIGRALLRAVKGEQWAGKGHRNATAYQISAEIVEAYPNCDPGSVVDCFLAAISLAQSHGSAMTADKWIGMVTRIQDDRRARLNMVHSLAAGAVAATLETQAKAVATASPAFADLPNVIHTLIILADGEYYLRRPDSQTYQWRLDSHEALRIELARQFGTANETVFTHDHEGKPLPIADLMLVYGSNAHNIVYDYSTAETTWDPTTSTLLIGTPFASHDPQIDEDVHAWCEAIAGDNIGDFYDWIAACKRECINNPAAALVIVGPRGAGKGVIATALAASWGAFPVPLRNVITRFNGSILRCPIWHADEEMPQGMSDAVFRDVVQARERLVERKGQEMVPLRGCGRLIFTLNEADDMRLGGLEGGDAIEAVIDRITYYDIRERIDQIRAALDRLMLEPGRVDLARIVRHFRAVQLLDPRPQRFLGAPAQNRAAAQLIAAQVAGRADDVLEKLVDYLHNPKAWEDGYHIDARPYPTGDRYPVVTKELRLWVNPSELAIKMGLRPADVKRSIKPFVYARDEITFGNRRLRGRYWAIDIDRLCMACNILPESPTYDRLIETVAWETRQRKPGCE